MSDENPYAPPQAEELEAAPSEFVRAERIRREHIQHEGQIRSVGCLQLLVGGLILLASLVSIPGVGSGGATPETFVLLIVSAGLGAALVVSGYGLRTLKPWARVPSALLCGIGLLGFPIGTLINAYFLFLILSSRGGTILTKEYAYVVTATPHVKYIPWAALLFLVLLFLILALVVAARL